MMRPGTLTMTEARPHLAHGPDVHSPGNCRRLAEWQAGAKLRSLTNGLSRTNVCTGQSVMLLTSGAR